ncbi:GNAT family N-acetyltransferase [Rhodobacterales bacterium HKCCE2091]|nr:GNAT family N-acetyltransferase [Rhodobacterales bacterium HKCCE2091]
MTDWPIREPAPGETAALARLWHDAWHDGHAAVVPPALTAIRTLEDFSERLPQLLPGLRTAGPEGDPFGLCVVRQDEIYQLFVARAARGSGLGARLLADGEAHIAASGHVTAHLDVAPGNARAEAFYARHGWSPDGLVVEQIATTQGPFALEVLRLTKRVRD